MNELVTTTHAADIDAQMRWAQAVVARPDGAAASLVPEAYRNNPANVLIAVGLGQSMGLSFAESLYRISVIKGKPSAAAELIASNVRKAGHKLRVKVTEDPPSATCTIIRADDPEEPTVITRDMAWAQRMGLAGELNYKRQPATMLSWRAISACARLACPEALYGVAYTPDELPDDDPPAAAPGAADFRAIGKAAASLSPPKEAEEPTPVDPNQMALIPPDDDIHDAEEVPGWAETGEQITDAQRRKMFALFTEAGFNTDARSDEGKKARLDYVSQVLSTPEQPIVVASTKELTVAQASVVIEALIADAEARTAAEQ